ncbi:hypothetical protein F4553_003959 [Allocatelliglobosispora scoriae]|uniref:Uncharacterized protein n=1 Tax=Allocatelliglobosispora scoriae TaxID=643052 RepID=A0A841BUZ0_9ACTN|nr:RRQRL motif-containing zinc-binding protein [Allocatelliglobosispora scoriae]MBB5870580.1 hypothetical protein [Allocatelliglobosispora scoriae]
MTATVVRPTGQFTEFYDPDGETFGLPTFPYLCAPEGLATRRQLRSAGLSPGGHDPVAQLMWRHRTTQRVAYLYDTALARPKRTATPRQLDAITAALTARRTCPTCTQVKTYYIPRRTGACLDCTPIGGRH